jgi:hypothetical protein
VREHVVETFEFPLTKKDGTATRQKARFSRLRFTFGEQTIRAGLAHSFRQAGDTDGGLWETVRQAVWLEGSGTPISCSIYK